jgi:hypothetical protein
MDSLNPSLFRALRQFGQIRLSDAGVQMTAIYQPIGDGLGRMRVSNAGEQTRCLPNSQTSMTLAISKRQAHAIVYPPASPATVIRTDSIPVQPLPNQNNTAASLDALDQVFAELGSVKATN